MTSPGGPPTGPPGPSLIARQLEGRRQGIRAGRPSAGNTPFGYRKTRERLLEVDAAEASVVRRVFQEYLETGSLVKTLQVLHREGLSRRRWSRPGLRFMLQNPIYVGRVRMAEIEAEGQHEAIVDAQTFERVQAIIQKNARKAARARLARDFAKRPQVKERCKHCGGPAISSTCLEVCKWSKPPPEAEPRPARVLKPQADPRGLVCRWCQATDSEVEFETKVECRACARARHRRSCSRCGGPASLSPRGTIACAYCNDPPGEYLVEIILIDAGSDRERRVFRPKHPRGGYEIGQYAVTDEDGVLTCVLPTPDWVRFRR